MRNIKLTVAIITYNEESNIERCINSIKEIADQILVVDSFSTDSTKSICNNLKVDFIENTFEGHIEQKNFALNKARYDFVLSLDADETLDKTAISSIKGIKQNWKYDGYEINRMTRYCGKWIKYCGWYPDTKLRLVDKSKSKWGGTNPHDKLNVNSNHISRLKGKILHYTLDTQKQHIDQINYFTDISSLALYKNGKSVTILKIILAPIFKFFRDYILKLGFLDGFAGFVICSNSAHAKFLKYVKLYYLNKTER